MIVHASAETFLENLANESIDLILTDPPYQGIARAGWDGRGPEAHAAWLSALLLAHRHVLKPHGSLVFFAGLGKHGAHPLFDVVRRLETAYTFRNWITWKKRRAYGKSHDYLYAREEILWFSKSSERTAVRFHIPLTAELRGYDGFREKYPAKSPYKRVSNVWTDIPELMRPTRECEKPVPLLRRLVETHSDPGDTVLDIFAGTGATEKACLASGRTFLGCDSDASVCDSLSGPAAGPSGSRPPS